MFRRVIRALPLGVALSLVAATVFAQDEGPSSAEVAYAIDNMMLFLAAVLVFFMQAGFALVEAGFNGSLGTWGQRLWSPADCTFLWRLTTRDWQHFILLGGVTLG